MRTLKYTVNESDGPISVLSVMKNELQLSAKEISHAKHFEDGITAQIDIQLGGRDRKYLHQDLYEDAAHEHSSKSVTKNMDDVLERVVHNRESVVRNEGRQAATVFDGSSGVERTYVSIRVRVSEVLYPGESLMVTLHEMEDDKGRIIPVPGPIDIIYEDKDLILLNKPAGIVAHPSPGHSTDSLANRLAYYYAEKNDPHRIRIIGRLDKEASGVLLFAKTRMAARALRRDTAYDKEYLAVCSGFFSKEHESATINYPILKRPEVILKREISQDGESAVTHYQVVSQGKDMALVRVKLETGRTHQIRLHMAAIGHPLIGDRIYNSAFEMQECDESVHAMLHAEKMYITHPVTGRDMTFTACIPDDMMQLINQLGGGAVD